jgi:sugar lactone lactonase YvrE
MCSLSFASGLRRGFSRLFVLIAVTASAVALAQTPAYVFSHLAGSAGGGGFADGTAAAAQFNRPQGLAFDSAGNLYVADSANQVIRKITPAGVVSTFAGKPGVSGYADGTGEAARFSEPRGLTADLGGNLYVAMFSDIRKITPAGATTTIASEGAMGLAADALGNLYFTTGGAVCRLDATGTVTTVAGSRTQPGHVDGNGTAARFYNATGMAFDAAGNLYVADDATVRCITPSGDVTTVAGAARQYPVSGSDGDGTGAAARFASLGSMALGPDGNVYVLEGLEKIRCVTPAGVVTTIRLAAAPPETGYENPGLAIDALGNLYVGNQAAHNILKVSGAGAVNVYAGRGNESGSLDATGPAARFCYPHGVAVDAAGTVYVADTANSVIRKITAAGAVSTLAGLAGTAGWVDGAGAAARFARPMGIAVDATGNVIVADTDNYVVRKITPAGVVTTIAGTFGLRGFTDGDAATARFYSLNEALAVAPDGSVYVMDNGAALRRISSDGSVVTVAGSSNQGSDDGTGAAAGFGGSSGLTVSADGTIYVADWWGMIRKVTAGGVVTTLAGTSWNYGHADGTGAAASFAAPRGIALGADNCLYVAEESNVRKVTLAGVVTTIGGGGELTGCADGTGGSARFASNRAIAIDPAGVLYIADTANHAIRKGVPVTAAVNWASPAPIIAGTPLSATQLNATANLPGTFAYTPAAGTVLTAGTHTLSVTFTPTDTVNFSPVTKTVTLTVRAGNYAGTYFGKVGNTQGTWALQINQNNTGRLLVQLPGRQSAIIAPVTIAADGTFSVTGHETIANGADGLPFTLSGTIDTGRVTAQLSGLNSGLTAIIDIGEETTASGYYTATALYQDSGTAYAVVGRDGRATVVIVTPGFVDTADGSLDRDGVFTGTTAGGAGIAVRLNSSAKSLSVGWGSGRLVEFGGLAEGVASTTRPMNMSARAYCSTGNSVTIGGFVVGGTVSKRVLIRAIGPSLTTQNIPQNEVLLDPLVEVHHGNAIVAQNDNWGDNANAADITSVGAQVGATALAATDTRSAAVLTTLDPGVYSFVVKGKGDTSGIVLLEAYDADATVTGTNFVNIAARAYATTGNAVAIGGFVVSGNAPKRVLMRAVGPTLTTQSIAQNEVLADPMIELHRGNAIVATNDNWGTNANQADIVTVGARIGAMPLAAADTKSSALLMWLPPGVYSFIAKGRNDTSGIVLVEVYDAD